MEISMEPPVSGEAENGATSIGQAGTLMQDTNGMLYGTAIGGGTNKLGTVYELNLGLDPFVTFRAAHRKSRANGANPGPGTHWHHERDLQRRCGQFHRARPHVYVGDRQINRPDEPEKRARF